MSSRVAVSGRTAGSTWRQRQHAATSRSAAATCATYRGSVPTGISTRKPAVRRSSRPRAKGWRTSTGTKRTSSDPRGRAAGAAVRSRRSRYSQYRNAATATPASIVNLACDYPDRSYRATTVDQYRRLSSRPFMPARVHPRSDHRQTSRVGRLRRRAIEVWSNPALLLLAIGLLALEWVVRRRAGYRWLTEGRPLPEATRRGPSPRRVCQGLFQFTLQTKVLPGVTSRMRPKKDPR